MVLKLFVAVELAAAIEILNRVKLIPQLLRHLLSRLHLALITYLAKHLPETLLNLSRSISERQGLVPYRVQT